MSRSTICGPAPSLWTRDFTILTLGSVVSMLGSISSIYTVAYESFHPLLITEGNCSKACSISSVLETLSALILCHSE